jgi:hypothetical protein
MPSDRQWYEVSKGLTPEEEQKRQEAYFVTFYGTPFGRQVLFDLCETLNQWHRYNPGMTPAQAQAQVDLDSVARLIKTRCGMGSAASKYLAIEAEASLASAAYEPYETEPELNLTEPR